jgi:hypothetical protein
LLILATETQVSNCTTSVHLVEAEFQEEFTLQDALADTLEKSANSDVFS